MSRGHRSVFGWLWLWLVSTHLHAATFDHGHAAFNALLHRHVKILVGAHASRVDYRGLARERDALSAYLQTLSRVTRADFDRYSQAQQMAFLINAYNGFTLALVLEHYPVGSIKDIGGFFASPWKKIFIHLLDEEVSLDRIESDWLRAPGRFDEPRVHFAINCASVGCPMLREEAYVADHLEAQLEDQTRRFLGDRDRNGVVDGRLRVSPIFKWYGEDWRRGERDLGDSAPSATGVQGFLARYSDVLASSSAEREAVTHERLPLTYAGYDWSLNDLR